LWFNTGFYIQQTGLECEGKTGFGESARIAKTFRLPIFLNWLTRIVGQRMVQNCLDIRLLNAKEMPI
jgi:hypothetical protein